MGQEVLQELLAAPGGHWDKALFSTEGAVLCFIRSFFPFPVSIW